MLRFNSGASGYCAGSCPFREGEPREEATEKGGQTIRQRESRLESRPQLWTPLWRTLSSVHRESAAFLGQQERDRQTRVSGWMMALLVSNDHTDIYLRGTFHWKLSNWSKIENFMQITTFLCINIFLCRHLVIWGQLSKKNMSKKSCSGKRKMSGISIVLMVSCWFYRVFSMFFFPSHVSFIDPSMYHCGQTVHYSPHWTDDILTRDLQDTVTLRWMKGGRDDNIITRLETYLWNYFQACLSYLVYKWAHPDCNRALCSALLSLFNYTCFCH